MTFETGIYQNRDILTGMTVLTALGIGFMQDIPDQPRPVTAMRVVTGTAVSQFGGEIWMFLLN